jgi:YVTN family beta-propeller protein
MRDPVRRPLAVALSLTAGLLVLLAPGLGVGTSLHMVPPTTNPAQQDTSAFEPSRLALLSPDGTSEARSHDLASPQGRVLETLNLQNGTLAPGNVVPSPCSFAYTSVAVAPSLHAIFVTCVGSDGFGSLIAFDTTSGLAEYSRPIGTDPSAVAFDPSTDEVYTANNGSNSVSVVAASDGTLVTTISVSGGPNAIAYDNSTRDLYITSYKTGNVTVVSSNHSVVGVIPTSGSAEPVGIAYDPASDTVAIAEDGPEVVGMISTANASFVANVTVDGQPLAVGCDAQSGAVYVGTYVATALFNHLVVVAGTPPGSWPT